MEYDVIVSGAGPSGSTTAAFLGKAGIKTLLLEKNKFPRDKACGDAIANEVEVINNLGIKNGIENLPNFKTYGVTFSSPNGKSISIPFNNFGYICKRIDLDNLIFETAKNTEIDIVENFTTKEAIIEDGFIKGVKGINEQDEEVEYRAKIVIGADGAHSPIAKSAELLNLDPKHTITAVRSYYTGIKDLSSHIELHFIDDVVPGYFWVFPLGDGRANVGLGMTIKDFRKKNWNMKDKMFEILDNNSLFKERFKDAKLEEGSLKGWTLPAASIRRKSYGNGLMLVGDAAGLIDPLLGDGITAAMRSGELAAKQAKKALEENDFSEKQFKNYEDNVWNEMGKKFATSYKIQRLGSFKFLINLLINKASKSNEIKNILKDTMDNEKTDTFINPSFYLKLLLA